MLWTTRVISLSCRKLKSPKAELLLLQEETALRTVSESGYSRLGTQVR